MLDHNYDITQLKGADYNPRKITDEQLAKLRESVTRLGVVKPIIARNGTIVAGHQRSKALLRLGITAAPVYVLSKKTSTYDEVQFNQLHNGTDLDLGDEEASFLIDGELLEPGYHEMPSSVLRCNYRARGAPIRATIADLIDRYGPWGACVCNTRGEVIHAAQYAITCSLAADTINVYVVKDEDEEFARELLAAEYGRFNYDAVKRATYIQTLAQPPRPKKDGKVELSRLYTYRLLPYLKEHPDVRVLDFGAGRGECARQSRELGYDVTDLEFFRRNNSNAIHVAAVHRMITKVETELKAKGPFDVTVCQAVLNSVDSVEAEGAVMACLNAFTRPGGRLFINGRSLEEHNYVMNLRCGAGSSRTPALLDENNFTANLRAGEWFFQKYHTLEQAKALVDQYGFNVVDAVANGNEFSGYWMVVAEKREELDPAKVLAGLEFEFDLIWPDGQSVGRSDTIKEALGLG